MDAQIIGEDDVDIGTEVTDNNGTVHQIEMHKSNGEIYAHEQDDYPDDPAKRTPENNEHVDQARQYAKYYVYRERGYDTLSHADNPEYVDAVRTAINNLTDAEFHRYFGAVHRQMRSHHDDTVERLIELPAAVTDEDAVVYEVDLYLGIDLEASGLEDRAEAIAQAHDLNAVDGTAPKLGSEVTDSDLEDWQEVGDELLATTPDSELKGTITATSGIHIGYTNEGTYQLQRADDPLEREPDATLELMPPAPESVEDFREYVDYHLRCQIRDCFVGMGLQPPEPFRVLGFGKLTHARLYDAYEFYPPLHIGSDEDDGGLF